MTDSNSETRLITTLAKALWFFVVAIGDPSPGWREIHDAMFSTVEQTAWDTARFALTEAEVYLSETVKEFEVSLFRKRPVEVHAWKASELLSAAGANWKQLPDAVKAAYEKGDVVFCPHTIHVKTLEGWLNAQKDDWIILGCKGEIYPCKPDVFEATYDEVTSSTSEVQSETSGA